MRKRGSIINGFVLIIIGGLLLMLQFLPAQFIDIIDLSQQWPLILIAIGALMFLGALGGSPSMAIPGSILIGLGGLMYVQATSGNWGSWSYAWTLILVFVGFGNVVAGLLGHRRSRSVREGGRLMVMGGIGFLLFGAFFGAFSWISSGLLWPLVMIVAGVGLMVRNALRHR